MFDIKLIREEPEIFDTALKRRKLEPQSSTLIEVDRKRREQETHAQLLQTRRNELSNEIGKLKAAGEDASQAIKEVANSKEKQAAAEEGAKLASEELNRLMAGIPNIPLPDVPDGLDAEDNVEIRKWGDLTSFDFSVKEHFDIGEALGMMDFQTAAKMSGSRFCILSGSLARLERALGAFMLDLHTTEHGYTEINPPALVRDNAAFGTGQLPKFKEDLFRTENGYWLIPTAEVPLTNIVSGEILDEVDLPQRYTAMTSCFRSEAGAAGKDTRGMLRQHQFTKVELVSITHPDASSIELERMTNCAEEVLKRLGLPYKTVLLATGDMGFSASKTYDIEVWLPGQNGGQGNYREISSCSTCGDFQARRMKARYRSKHQKGTRFVHTLNGSGIAVGRALIAILENYQKEDGSVEVPEVLQKYMGGLDVIRKDT